MSLQKARGWLGTLVGMAVAFAAGASYAADSPLDEAHALAAKAVALLKSAEGGDDAAPSAAHRKKAIELLTRAQSEILKAKQ